MGTFSRRALLAKSGLGAAAVGVLAVAPKLVRAQQHTPVMAAKQQQSTPGTVPSVAYVRDAAKGEVVLMVGTRQIVRTDPTLVAYLSRCCGTGAV